VKITEERDYVDYGLGFPVIISRVKIARVGNESVPLIDFKALEEVVLEMLADKPTRLTGAELRFIRLHFDLTLADFGAWFGVSHAAVIKWEKKGVRPTGMAWSTEKDVRLFILNMLEKSPREFLALYKELAGQRPCSAEPLCVPFRKKLVADVSGFAFA